jgi:hypothetical protein
MCGGGFYTVAIFPCGAEQAALYGLSTNKNNGIHNCGFKFDVLKKLSVKVSYQRLKEANRGLQPNLAHIASDCNVSPNYAKNIESEMRDHAE